MRSKLKQFIRSQLTPANDSNRDLWVIGKLSGLAAGAKLLDAGSGTQPYREFADHLQYYSQDFSKYDGVGDGTGRQKNFPYGKMDYVCNIWEIPEQDSFFDAILCTEVLEHVPYPNETLIEFARLIKDNGALLLTAPFAAIPHMAPYFYFSGFSQNYYQEKLAQAGFEILSMEANGDAFAYLAQELIRLRQNFPGRFVKALFLMFTVPILLGLRIFRVFGKENAGYLVFGYHIHARRKARP